MYDPHEMPESKPLVDLNKVEKQQISLNLNLNLVYESVTQQLVWSIKETVEKEVIQIVRTEAVKAIREQVQSIVVASMEAGVQATNEWGEPKGQPKPFKEVVKSELNTILNSKSYNRSAKIEELVKAKVEEVFKNECKSEVDKFMESFKEGLMLQTTEYLRKQIEKVVK